MSDRRPTRRSLLGTVGAAAFAGLAGCSGSNETTPDDGTATESPSPTSTPSQTTTETTTGTAGPDGMRGPRNGDDLPKDTLPQDGYPPEFETVPRKRQVNPGSFETLMRGNIEVKLVPTDVAYYWYARGEARFADARSESEFDVSHVFGAVLSPAGDGEDLPDDPALTWPKGDRIVTYCDCPHHLSSLRAASLKKRGYKEVYALDEGFSAWREHDFPLAGSDVGRVPDTWVINGSVPMQYGGETAWAYHTDSNQREATEIASDGSYELHLKFVNVNSQSRIRIETPAYSLTAPLGDLANGHIRSDGTLAGGSSGTATGGSPTGTATGTSTSGGGNGTATNGTANGTSTGASQSFVDWLGGR